MHLAGQGGGADYGVVGEGKAGELLFDGEGGFGADAYAVGETFVVPETGRIVGGGRGGCGFRRGGVCRCGSRDRGGGWVGGRGGALDLHFDGAAGGEKEDEKQCRYKGQP